MPLKPPKGFIDESDPKVAQIGHPAPPWLVNYADLMTEIACFFIILYALSTSLNKQVQQAVEEVQKMVNTKQISGTVKVDREGLKITLNEEGHVSFFKSGEADTTPAMDAMIAKLVPTLRKLAEDHDIIVEGHTDNRKIANQYFDSNWELSTARATTVVRLLKNKYGLPPNRLGALGYGQYRPFFARHGRWGMGSQSLGFCPSGTRNNFLVRGRKILNPKNDTTVFRAALGGIVRGNRAILAVSLSAQTIRRKPVFIFKKPDDHRRPRRREFPVRVEILVGDFTVVGMAFNDNIVIYGQFPKGRHEFGDHRIHGRGGVRLSAFKERNMAFFVERNF